MVVRVGRGPGRHLLPAALPRSLGRANCLGLARTLGPLVGKAGEAWLKGRDREWEEGVPAGPAGGAPVRGAEAAWKHAPGSDCGLSRPCPGNKALAGRAGRRGPVA